MIALVGVVLAASPLHVVVDADVAEVELWRTREPAHLRLVEPLRPLCTAPCDADIEAPEVGGFYVEGPGAPSSAVFSMDSSAREVRLHVHGGDLSLDRLGWALGLCGGGAIIVGLDGLLVGSPRVTAAFAMTAVVGAVLEALGLWLQYHARSVVRLEDVTR